MTLNHSKIKADASLLCIFFFGTVCTVGMQQFKLINFNVVHYSSLFQYFFRCTMVPTPVETS